MSYQSILEYLAELSKSYFQADKIRKSQFLDHAELITKYNRKSIIRVLKNKENLSNQTVHDLIIRSYVASRLIKNCQQQRHTK